MSQTFLEPQPYNVPIEPEDCATPHVGMPVLGPAVPVVEQEMTPEPDLYPRFRHGVVPRGRVR